MPREFATVRIRVIKVYAERSSSRLLSVELNAFFLQLFRRWRDPEDCLIVDVYTPTNFPSFTRTSFEGPDKYQAKRPLKKNIVEQCASFIRFERINRGATFRIHDVRSSGSTAGCSPALMTSLDGWQARS